MENSKVTLKKRKPVTNSSRTTLTCALVGLVVLTVILISVYYARASAGGSTTRNTNYSEEYEALLRRAKALTEKYSELTGRAPKVDETKIPDHSGNANTVAIAGSAGKNSKDMVIGMAQDTDSKNLVCSFSRFTP